jgi:NTE family protein
MAARRRARSAVKRVNLALQGGGSHGAFIWGILDCFLEDGRLEFEGFSGTSAGSMNAVVCAAGLMEGGAEGARTKLRAFWKDVSDYESGFIPPVAAQALRFLRQSTSPYQWNPMNVNPLRDALKRHVDFARLRRSSPVKLFISATNVETGRVRVFDTGELTPEVVLASACLPHFFQAVRIGSEYFWDGGYMGNPVLFPLIYKTESRDVVILHIDPVTRKGVPTSLPEIDDRLSEITFNSALIRELRAIAFVQGLIAKGWLKKQFEDRMKHVLVHSVRADKALGDLSVETKTSLEWSFLEDLRGRGRGAGAAWLKAHYRDLGRRQSVDLKKEFL